MVRFNSYSYFKTLAMGIPPLLVLGWFGRHKMQRSPGMRFGMSLAFALVVCPAAWDCNGTWSIDPAWCYLIAMAIGRFDVPEGLLVGAVPVIFLSGVVYGSWHWLSHRRGGSGKGE